MNRSTLLLLLTSLLGCASNSSTPAPCVVEQGPSSCQRILQASCQRYVQCCTNADGTCASKCRFSTGDYCTVDHCIAANTPSTTCSVWTGRYSGKTTCDATTSSCVAEIASTSCDVLFAAGSPGAACETWSASFPKTATVGEATP